MAQAEEAAAEPGAVAEQKKQGQQGEAEDDQPVHDFAAEPARRIGRNVRGDAAEQRVHILRVAQIGLPPSGELGADAGQPRQPNGHRQAGVPHLIDILQKIAALARDLDRGINQRDDQDQADQRGQDERRQNPRAAPR